MYLRYLILLPYWEYGTIILVSIESPYSALPVPGQLGQKGTTGPRSKGKEPQLRVAEVAPVLREIRCLQFMEFEARPPSIPPPWQNVVQRSLSWVLFGPCFGMGGGGGTESYDSFCALSKTTGTCGDQ